MKRKVRLISVEYTRDFYGYNDEMHGLYSEFTVIESAGYEDSWDDDGYTYRVEDLEFLD